MLVHLNTDIFAEYLFYVLAKQNAKFHDNLMPTFFAHALQIDTVSTLVNNN
jgi:hypothetical protein